MNYYVPFLKPIFEKNTFFARCKAHHMIFGLSKVIFSEIDTDVILNHDLIFYNAIVGVGRYI